MMSMDGFTRWAVLPAAVAIAPCAYATQYLTIEQAQQLIFPGATLAPEETVRISDEQRREIERRTGLNVRQREQRVWRSNQGGFFIVDEVVGKHEFITYAAGINADGSVRQIEILDYRESYGYEVRTPAWRRQFVGKRAGDHLKLDEDIKNIGGATLSCRHITDGVKRLLAFYEVALK
jgi:hypothetical protein